jgi:hypothetical protein
MAKVKARERKQMGMEESSTKGRWIKDKNSMTKCTTGVKLTKNGACTFQ